jgi:uncharacterized protein (DUF362 family)
VSGFVKIKSVFDAQPSNRTVEDLAALYQDLPRLKAWIADLVAPQLNRDTIANRKVFLKPNWVKHSTRPTDAICLRTHENFILATVEVLLPMQPASIVIGDAPIQGCKWGQMILPEFENAVSQLSKTSGIPIEIKDLRRLTLDLTAANPLQSKRSLDDFVIFDLGKKSYLEPITKGGRNRFRVTHYNPDRFNESHRPGMHKYCITKELFEADVVISLPKVKTHEKAGITNALKNLVGLNGDKDFLPHHRLGGTKRGGDSYPGDSLLRYWSELCHDNANRNMGTSVYWWWLYPAILLWRLSKPGPMDRFGAGWHGNDTTWRMVMDLNMIALYGKADATVGDKPQRLLFSLCDGIVGGEKDGPLTPSPLNLGLICFTNDSSWADLCMATTMGMDIEKIPLLRCAKGFTPHAATQIEYNQSPIQLIDLQAVAVEAVMPGGWLQYKSQTP